MSMILPDFKEALHEEVNRIICAIEKLKPAPLPPHVPDPRDVAAADRFDVDRKRERLSYCEHGVPERGWCSACSNDGSGPQRLRENKTPSSSASPSDSEKLEIARIALYGIKYEACGVLNDHCEKIHKITCTALERIKK